MRAPVERYAFVAVTSADLAAARRFWTSQLGFAVTEEEPDQFFIVDAGGLRLCVDRADGDAHRTGSSDPVLGFHVESLDECLAGLRDRGVRAVRGPEKGDRGRWASILDPDGRTVILTESD